MTANRLGLQTSSTQQPNPSAASMLSKFAGNESNNGQDFKSTLSAVLQQQLGKGANHMANRLRPPSHVTAPRKA